MSEFMQEGKAGSSRFRWEGACSSHAKRATEARNRSGPLVEARRGESSTCIVHGVSGTGKN